MPHTRSKQVERFLDAVSGDPFVREMLEGRLSFEWASVCMVSDDPSKVRGRVRDSELLWTRLKRIVKEPAEELGAGIGVLRAGQAGGRPLRGVGQGRREGHHSHQLARGHRRRRRACRLRQAPEAPARCRHHPVRAQTDGRAEHPEASWPRRQLRFQPSRQDVRDRPLGGVRRLVQLRPALDSAQHGARIRDRQPGARERRWPIRSSDPSPTNRIGCVWVQAAGSNGWTGSMARMSCTTGSPEPACGGD